jgi:Tol biopolymer transport system component
MLHSVACLLALVVAADAPADAPSEYPTGVFVMKADGGDVHRVAVVHGYFDHGSPRFSHDGRRLAFDAALGDPHGPRACFVVNVDGTGLAQLCTGRTPDWSPDDKQIAFVGEPAGEIFVQNVDGKGRAAIAKGGSPSFSPDGGRLALSDRRMLRVVDLLSGEETAVLPEPQSFIFEGFAWSPDGKQLAVAARSKSKGPRHLFIVDAAGNNAALEPRLENAMGGFVSYSPDGRQIVFADQWKIKIVDVAGNAPAREVPGQQGLNRNPVFSPDGKSIVFVSTREAPEEAPRNGARETPAKLKNPPE